MLQFFAASRDGTAASHADKTGTVRRTPLDEGKFRCAWKVAIRGFALARLHEARCCVAFFHAMLLLRARYLLQLQEAVAEITFRPHSSAPVPCCTLRLYVLHTARCTPKQFSIPGGAFYTLHSTRYATHFSPYLDRTLCALR